MLVNLIVFILMHVGEFKNILFIFMQNEKEKQQNKNFRI